jgi:fatty acid desaturase
MALRSSVAKRDYSLTGAETQRAIDRGLTSGNWYQTPIPRKRLKELMQRSDGPALRDTAIWLGSMVLTAAGGIWFWGTWYALPFFLLYGVLYGSGGDARWHEMGHRTAFRTSWMNDVVYVIGSFMQMANPTKARWSHTRHHTDTIIVGRDPEIVAMRPPRVWMFALDFLGLVSVPTALWTLTRHAFGRLSADEKTFVPESERWKVQRDGAAFMAIYVATIASAVLWQSWLPVLLIGGPRIYGIWLVMLMGNTQHMGLDEDILDHRLNSRTVYMNPFFRFIYMNMNYHVEHHMYPMPELHREIRHDCPPPYPSVLAAWAEMVPTLLRQTRDPTHFAQRHLPPGAGGREEHPARASDALRAAE